MNEPRYVVTVGGRDTKTFVAENKKRPLIIETVIYEVQKAIDEKARQQGEPYGEIVSARDLQDKPLNERKEKNDG